MKNCLTRPTPRLFSDPLVTCLDRSLTPPKLTPSCHLRPPVSTQDLYTFLCWIILNDCLANTLRFSAVPTKI